MDNLFDIAHPNALEMMQSEEDKNFLKLQRQKGRPGSMVLMVVMMLIILLMFFSKKQQQQLLLLSDIQQLQVT
ncbi:hypothetical protein HAZT_HAZT002449 [Hyalella azteca]|uniref:Uncharacterized protein n=1 Tax=Hyalella azteca TaxID=294128 RepID=A0A6A0GNI7_HYAAZ|nr:hypothetical protein HAZT_HAZT002449 [Hyalella azteca]